MPMSALAWSAIVNSHAARISLAMLPSLRETSADLRKIAGCNFRFLDEMRDELARIAREQRTDQIGNHRAAHLRLLDERAIEKLTPFATLHDDAALLEP